MKDWFNKIWVSRKDNKTFKDIGITIFFSIIVYWSTTFIDYSFLFNFINPVQALPVMIFLTITLLIFSARRWNEYEEQKNKREKAEKMVISGRSELQAVLDGVPDIIVQVDSTMRIRWANKAALEKSPNAIGFRASQAFSYDEGTFLDSYCNWAMELRQIKKGISYQPFKDEATDFSYWEGIGVPLKKKGNEIYGAIAIARDITNRMRVEHTWNLLTSIVESTIDAIFGVHWDGTILSWNSGAEQTYGYRAQEIIGKSITTLVPVDMRNELLEKLEWVSRKEIVERLDTTRICKDGRLIYVSQTICPFVDATGKKVGVSLIDRDITEAVTAEKALRESEARFKGLFAHMSSGVMVFATTNMAESFFISNINDSVEKIEKIEKDEIIGKSTDDFEKGSFIGQLINHVRNTWSNDKPLIMPITIKEKNSIISWRQTNIYKLPSGEVVVIYEDITQKMFSEEALRKSEEKFRTLVGTAPDGIVLTDSDGTIIELNDAFAKILEYKRPDLLGSNIIDALPGTDGFEDFSRFMYLMKEDKSLIPKEFVTKTKSRRNVPIEWALEIMSDSEGSLVGLIAIIRDITIRKEVEIELKKSRELLRNRAFHLEIAREEERKKIAFEIHDELGYLLTAIKLDAGWLSEKIDPERTKLHERFENMEELIDTTVKKVRSISGKLRPSVLDHFGVVAALEQHGFEFQRRTGIRCIMDFEVKEARMDDDFATAVFRIFQETLTNVSRHSQATRVDLYLKFINGVLVLDIKDNGVGFDGNSIGENKSFGLLGIRERAKFMGAEVNIISSPGNGTEILLKIPFNKEDIKYD